MSKLSLPTVLECEAPAEPVAVVPKVLPLHEWQTLPALLWLSGPVLVEQVLHMLVGLSDKVLAGQFLPGTTESHLAAISSMAYLLWLLTELFVFVAVGATVLIARFTGAGDRLGAVRTLHQAMLVGLPSAALLSLLAFLYGDQLVGLIGLQGEAAALASRALRWVIPVLPAVFFESLGVACLRGAGDTIGGLWIMAVVNVVNISVAWCFMLGFGPVEAWGWDGIAFGTACGHLAGGLTALGMLLAGRAGLRLQWSLFRFDWPLIKRLLRVGVPGGVDIMLVIICQLWFLSIVNRLGEVSAAAHGFAISIESLAYLPGTAFQVAAATLVGQYLGARQPQRAMRCVQLTVCITLLITVFSGAVFYLAGERLAGLLIESRQQTVIQLCAQLLRIVALAMPALALLMVFNGALRGAGDTRSPLVINLLGFLLVRIPLAYALTMVLPWGIVGAWYAMLIDLFIRASLASFRFYQGKWQGQEV